MRNREPASRPMKWFGGDWHREAARRLNWPGEHQPICVTAKMVDTQSIAVASAGNEMVPSRRLYPDFRVLQFDSACGLVGMWVMGRTLDKSTRAEFNARTYPRMDKSAPLHS